MNSCIVHGCQNKSSDSSGIVRFFRLPENQNKLIYWMSLIHREDLQFTSNLVLQKYRICSEHFLPAHIDTNGQINERAIPIKNIKEPCLNETMHEDNIVVIESDDESEPSHENQYIKIKEEEEFNIKQEIEVKQEVEESDPLLIRQDSLQGCTTTKTTQSAYAQTEGHFLAHHKRKVDILTNSLKECTKENKRLKWKLLQNSGKGSTTKTQLNKLRESLQASKQENLRLHMKIQKDSKSFAEKLKALVEGGKIQTEIKKNVSLYSCPEYKKMALNLFLCSRLAYKYASPYFDLPTIDTLYLNMADTRSGILLDHFETLREAAGHMTPKEKICNVCVDYMPISSGSVETRNSHYVRHEIDGVVEDLPAKFAVVIAVTGVVTKWRQVLGFALTAECKHYPELIMWIKETIIKLIDIQLDVKCLVTDTCSFFRTSIFNKSVSVNKPHFTIGGKKLFYIYDVPHLIRSARNMLMKNDIVFLDDKIAKWHVVQDVYEKSQSRLTTKHMSLSGTAKSTTFAAQIFSLSLAKTIESLVKQNILEPEAKDTAEFLVRFNNLFDNLNSLQSKRIHKYTFKQPYCGSSEQKQFFKESLLFLDSIRIKNTNAGMIDTPFVKGFMITISSVMGLYEDLEDIDVLWTRNLNLEPLKVLYKHIKLLSPSKIGFIRANEFRRGILKFSMTDSLKIPGISRMQEKGRKEGRVSGTSEQGNRSVQTYSKQDIVMRKILKK